MAIFARIFLAALVRFRTIGYVESTAESSSPGCKIVIVSGRPESRCLRQLHWVACYLGGICACDHGLRAKLQDGSRQVWLRQQCNNVCIALGVDGEEVGVEIR